MADESPQQELAKAVIPFDANTDALDQKLDGIEQRADDLADKFAKMLDPLLVKADEFADKMDEAKERANEHILTPAGDRVEGPSGVGVTPLGPAASMTDTTRTLIVMEDIYNQLRQLNDLLPQLIAALTDQT